MKDSQILSVFTETTSQPGTSPLIAPVGRPARPAPIFDACHVGVTLRAMFFVEAVMAVGAMFGAADIQSWLMRVAVLSGAAFPATLAWLVTACLLKRVIARLPAWGQHTFGVLLGAGAAMYGAAMLAWAGFAQQVPWVASAFTGALLAAALVAGLALRAKGRAPADANARLAELQARIRPHFLFNTLNSAIALVREDPARAEMVLEDLSDLFRHALMEQGDSVTLDEEIALARRYLDIEQVRFGDRLRVEWSLDPTAGSARVPPLVLQPLVENAVKHGVEPSDSGARVKVSTQRRAGSVVIKVTNSVPSGQGSPGHGVAQDNVRDRLRLLHDVQGQFHAQLKDGIYLVRMEVPA